MLRPSGLKKCYVSQSLMRMIKETINIQTTFSLFKVNFSGTFHRDYASFVIVSRAIRKTSIFK